MLHRLLRRISNHLHPNRVSAAATRGYRVILLSGIGESVACKTERPTWVVASRIDGHLLHDACRFNDFIAWCHGKTHPRTYRR